MDAFRDLLNVRWSDNTCTVGWSCIHAHHWDRYSIDAALRFCPRGHFTSTSYVGGDERRLWTPEQKKEWMELGAPVYVYWRGAYFNFPLDRGALQLMQAVGLINECMVMAASGGRFPFPDDGFARGGLPLCG